MGYYSDVRIVTTKKGWDILNKKAEEKYEGAMNGVEIIYEKYDFVYGGWACVKWYDNFEDVQAVMKTLREDMENIPWRFARYGEDDSDFETECSESAEEENLPYIYTIHNIDDDEVIGEFEYIKGVENDNAE